MIKLNLIPSFGFNAGDDDNKPRLFRTGHSGYLRINGASGKRGVRARVSVARERKQGDETVCQIQNLARWSVIHYVMEQ